MTSILLLLGISIVIWKAWLKRYIYLGFILCKIVGWCVIFLEKSLCKYAIEQILISYWGNIQQVSILIYQLVSQYWSYKWTKTISISSLNFNVYLFCNIKVETFGWNIFNLERLISISRNLEIEGKIWL